VELDPSLEKCPLCNTPVINPNAISYYQNVSPYPTVKGQVEPVKRRDLVLLISVMLLTISATCGLLNLFVFKHNKWSFLVFGFCLIIWVFTVPTLLTKKISAYIHIFVDGSSILFYLYLISHLTGSKSWVPGIGLPIVLLVTATAEVFWYLEHHFRVTFLNTCLYLFASIAVICVGVELICRQYLHIPYGLSWSAVVLTVCCIFIIAIITLLLRPRLRNALRRRMHF
jgi:hypothetical protein